MTLKKSAQRQLIKYFLVGREGGPNNPQWYITFEKCNNIISQSLPNIQNKMQDCVLKEQIKNVIKVFFIDHGENVDSKYRYIINTDHYFPISKTIHDIFLETSKDDAKNAHKKLLDAVSKEVTKACANELEIKVDQIGLFTVCINGEPIALTEEYRNLIEESLEERIKIADDSSKVCSICGSNKGCTSDLSEMSIKFYTTNQCIFANNMNRKNYTKNFMLCTNCYKKLLCAENFIQNELHSRIAGYDVYIVPHISYGKNLNRSKIKKMAEIIDPLTNTSKAMEAIAEYREETSRRLSALNDENYIFLLNFIFYRKLQAATKIQKMIKDVNPSIFSDISNSFFNAHDTFTMFFPEGICEGLKRKIGLGFIYYMHSVKLKDGSPTQYQKILSTYESIFCKKSLKSDVVFSNIIDVLLNIWREKPGFNTSFDKDRIDRQKAFDFKVIDCMFYIKFLQNYGSLGGGEIMDLETLCINNDMKSYVQTMGYNEQQTALFLLGVLIGAIGREQSSRQREKEQEGTYKPILNKINFSGMDKYRIMKLSNDIPNKLRHEKIQKYHEATFSAHKHLLDKNIQQWKLNKDESLYYLLSGYGYQTMKKKIEREDENNDQQ
ncbi:MAG: TIGR02556 family CRISPR-associated protein [Clostridiaceae bacterium]|nr:TIGR02556 family CRISPR-associated protein [Clostridiaceae bacterium]